MAGFFNNLGSNLGNIGKTITEKAEVVTRKTEDAVEIQKIKNQARVMERNNERDFQDIGKMVYECFKAGKPVDTAYVELCEAIAGREETIEAYEKQIADIKGLDLCPNCNEHLDADASFCPNCGAKVEREKPVEEAEEETAEDEVDIVEVVEGEVVEEVSEEVFEDEE